MGSTFLIEDRERDSEREDIRNIGDCCNAYQFSESNLQLSHGPKKQIKRKENMYLKHKVYVHKIMEAVLRHKFSDQTVLGLNHLKMADNH